MENYCLDFYRDFTGDYVRSGYDYIRVRKNPRPDSIYNEYIVDYLATHYSYPGHTEYTARDLAKAIDGINGKPGAWTLKYPHALHYPEGI